MSYLYSYWIILLYYNSILYARYYFAWECITLLVSDAVLFMVKVSKLLYAFFPKMIHLTYLNKNKKGTHAFHQIGVTIFPM